MEEFFDGEEPVEVVVVPREDGLEEEASDSAVAVEEGVDFFEGDVGEGGFDEGEDAASVVDEGE